MSSSIERELVRCRQSAEEGYSLANAKYSDIENTLINAANSLSKTDAEQNQVSRIRNTDLVEKQRAELQQLKKQIGYIGGDLQNLRGRMKDFSIVVYGRTMAGKSTLMEILTHGDGKSIGKGSQRTTLDVRDYYWNGLKITDVPGIAAFSADAKEARVDESLALAAAKKADLILFLLTSDAPQADEAEKLAQLRSLGKPVLGVINVKMTCNINDDLDIEDLQDKLADTRTIDATIEQFKNFAANHNQDWSGIKFVATHLLSAYESQGKNPKVFQISRFAEVEDFILDKVRSDGRFLRIKTFADAVAVPMNNVILEIYKHSGNTLRESDVYFDKRRQLDAWREKFVARAQERLNSLYNQLSNELDSAISNFAYDHYEDQNAGENWQRRFQSLKFDEKYRDFLKSLTDECERKRKELSEELAKERSHLSFDNNARVSVQMDGTTPWGQYAALVLPNLLMFVPGIGWAARLAIGVGSFIFSSLFEDKQAKIRENRQKLRDAIAPPSYDVLDKMHNKVIDTFNDEILAKGIDGFSDVLAGYQFMLARLGKSQYDMAYNLFSEFSNLNLKLFIEASNYKGAGSAKEVTAIARIPGEIAIILAERWNLDTQALSDLLGEKIFVMRPEAKFPDTVEKVLDGDFDIDSYPLDFTKDNEEPPHAYAVLPKNNVDATKFKLAQQIAGVPIIIKNSASNTTTLPNVSGKRTTSSNDAFDSDFKRISNMIGIGASKYDIKLDLYTLRNRARNLRNAAAMRKIADYYDEIGERTFAKECRDEAKTFTNQPQTSSGERTQSNAFDADFAEIEKLIRDNWNEDIIGGKLDKLRLRARNLRDAKAMRKIADYYDKIYAYHRASLSREEAKTF